jgi:hypothetical protein
MHKSTVDALLSKTDVLELVEQGEYKRAAEILESLLPEIQDVQSRNRALYILGNSFR